MLPPIEAKAAMSWKNDSCDYSGMSSVSVLVTCTVGLSSQNGLLHTVHCVSVDVAVEVNT